MAAADAAEVVRRVGRELAKLARNTSALVTHDALPNLQRLMEVGSDDALAIVRDWDARTFSGARLICGAARRILDDARAAPLVATHVARIVRQEVGDDPPEDPRDLRTVGRLGAELVRSEIGRLSATSRTAIAATLRRELGASPSPLVRAAIDHVLGARSSTAKAARRGRPPQSYQLDRFASTVCRETLAAAATRAKKARQPIRTVALVIRPNYFRIAGAEVTGNGFANTFTMRNPATRIPRTSEAGDYDKEIARFIAYHGASLSPDDLGWEAEDGIMTALFQRELLVTLRRVVSLSSLPTVKHPKVFLGMDDDEIDNVRELDDLVASGLSLFDDERLATAFAAMCFATAPKRTALVAAWRKATRR